MVGATGTVEGAASKLILALPQWQDGRVRATELTRARFRSVLPHATPVVADIVKIEDFLQSI